LTANPLFSAFCGTTREIAEEGLFDGGFGGRALQGLKPTVDLIGFIGTTEVVPFQNGGANRVFPQPLKSWPFKTRL
jgi:hypothetical protein